MGIAQMGIAQMGIRSLFLMCSHLIIIFPPKSVFDLVDL